MRLIRLRPYRIIALSIILLLSASLFLILFINEEFNSDLNNDIIYNFEDFDNFSHSQKKLNVFNVSSRLSFYVTLEHQPGERTGNILFQYASFYGISRNLSFVPLLRESEPIINFFDQSINAVFSSPQWQQYFGVPERALEWDMLSKKQRAHLRINGHDSILSNTRLVRFKEKLSSIFDSRINDLRGINSHIMISGYFQSYKYFQLYKSEICQQFRFSSTLRKRAHAFLESARYTWDVDRNSTLFVGVHGRLGDMLMHAPFVAFGYRTAPDQYLVRAARLFRERLNSVRPRQRVRFVLCSDTLAMFARSFPHEELCDETTGGPCESDTVIADDPSLHLALLAESDHVLLTVGTFGWWGAFLAGCTRSPLVTYYARPFAAGSQLAAQFNHSLSDFYPPEWISIDAPHSSSKA